MPGWETEMKYVRPPRGCTPGDGNPFSPDGKYGPEWTGLALGDGNPFVGTSESGLFHYQFDRNDPNVAAIVADFIRYENEHGRAPMLFFPEDIDVDAWVAHALSVTPLPHVIRDTDPEYLVHSTSVEAGRQILRDRELKSFSRLCREGSSPSWHHLRSDSLGEPSDYARHINFGPIDSPWVESVAASHADGRFLTPDDPYVPGYRFYVHGHKIIEAGLDVRVAGAVKVRDRLPLDPHLAAAISIQDADPHREAARWTPRMFTQEANNVFAGMLDKTGEGS